MRGKIIHDDCREALDRLPASSVHCVVTSPPYWKQRDYEDNDQIGQEETHHEYLDSLWDVFFKCWNLLTPSGTLWVNIGDKYLDGEPLGLPWLFVFGMRNNGWRFCQEIIWHKTNPLTTDARRRCVPAHEHIFLFSKQADYYFDKEAIKEKGVTHDQAHMRSVWSMGTQGYKGAHFAPFPSQLAERCIKAGCPARVCETCQVPYKREIARTRVPTRPGAKTKATRDARVQGNRDPQRHVTLTRTTGWAKQCKCPDDGYEGGVVLDPFFGAGTVGLVAEKLNRRWIGLEVNAEYVLLAQERIGKEGKSGFGLGGE